MPVQQTQAITEVTLPVTGDPYQNVDEIGLEGVSALVQDAYVDDLDHTVKRPGLARYADLGTGAGVDGLFWWNDQALAVAVSAGRVFKGTDFAGTFTEVTGTSGLVSGVRVSFASDGTNLLMANGGKMTYMTSSSALSVMADADAPTAVTHLAYLDTYILANEAGSGRFHFSDVGSTTSWNALSFSTADALPDNIKALHTGWRELVLVGGDSLEFWYDDGATPFRRIQGGAIEWGNSAPYTFKQVGQYWTWLDHRRRFVRLNNRTPEVISTPYDGVIQSFGSVDDAFSDMIYMGGQSFYVTTFPLANRTLVYNVDKNGWSEWSWWNSTTAQYNRFRGQSYCYARNWNLHLIGDQSNGLVYTLSSSNYTDNGVPIRGLRRTGHITHGTSKFKRSHELRIRCKRNTANAATATPQMVVRWRDDNGAWGNDHLVDMGQAGDGFIFARLQRLGTYRERQWEFIHSDPAAWILVDVKEDIEVLSK